MIQGFDGLVGEKDSVAGGFGELLDACCHVDGVTDEGELKLAAAADGAGDHRAGVDPDADSKLPAESLGDTAVNQHRGADSGVGMLREVVGGAEDGQRAVAEELVDMPTRVDDGRHDDLEQRVEAGDRVLGRVCLREWG